MSTTMISILSRFITSLLLVGSMGTALGGEDGDRALLEKECPGFAQWEAQKAPVPKADGSQAAGSDAALRKSLLRMERADQSARNFNPLEIKNEQPFKKVEMVDNKNLLELRKIVAAGIPTRAAVGEDGLRAFWLLVQHADRDPKLQEKVLIALKNADSGLPRDEMAMLTDRIRVNEGHPQVYGTQFRNVGKDLVPNEIEDPAEVDARRASVGLMPLSVYQCALTVTYRAMPAPPAAK